MLQSGVFLWPVGLYDSLFQRLAATSLGNERQDIGRIWNDIYKPNEPNVSHPKTLFIQQYTINKTKG
jgi:hypothetical protein